MRDDSEQPWSKISREVGGARGEGGVAEETKCRRAD